MDNRKAKLQFRLKTKSMEIKRTISLKILAVVGKMEFCYMSLAQLSYIGSLLIYDICVYI